MATESLLMLAAALAVFTGIVHSLLGELLIFRRLARGSLVPKLPAPPLSGRHVRILWATWHLASVFGWAFAALLWRMAGAPGSCLSAGDVLSAIALANLIGAALVLVGTRARHPGWIALSAIAVCCGLAARALH